MLKVATVSVTQDTYASIGSILAGQTGQPYGTGRRLRNGLFINKGAVPVTLSIVQDSAITGNDDASVALAAGDTLPFEEINLGAVYVKSTGDNSTLEVIGEV